MRKPREIVIKNKTLEQILKDHRHWLNRDCKEWQNMYADLSGADLEGINFNDMEAFCDTAIQALKQESETATEFTKWVVSEIFDENWEYNKDAFAELACRKLAKLGIVKEKGDEWELIESQVESEDKE